LKSVKRLPRDLMIGKFKEVKKSVRLGDLWGNRFTISLRNINRNISSEDLSK